ncbi:MAG TPA: aminodeoxychorismate synthase component I [Verrucomicrobiae bacterium]|nr:aminodeoxychorismate synthase component I [Verrucomicrobiae bacterium]
MNQQPVARKQPWTEPRDRFAEFAAKPYAVWLDTATGATGYSILAAGPSKIVRSKGSQTDIITPTGTTHIEGNPFDILGEQLAPHYHGTSGDFPLGAAIGYFGYDLKNFVERLPAKAPDDIGLPDCWFGFYDNLLVFDHAKKEVWEVIGGSDSCRSSGRRPLTSSPSDHRSNFTRDSYRVAILRAKQYIAAGDIYQVNLSQRFQCGVDAAPTELYRALRESNPAPYCAYLDIGEAQILSSSPECFLNIHDRRVVTRPIKGTRPRGATIEEDTRIATELLASPKDNAELVMITDLERNDLGRVCEFGSVQVSELVRVETYATVHHLVSTVEGRLRSDVSPVDCVRACFPGGSITGAPKIRAMEIIDELEPHARGVYTGAIGFLGYNGLTHLNVAIRTVVQQGRELTFHAGGGIVADSEPDAEYDETLVKAQGILNAIKQLRLR